LKGRFGGSWRVAGNKIIRYASMTSIHDNSNILRDSNPNHHLWNNNGVWWIHYTFYPSPVTAERVRGSLKTKSLTEARRRRDRIFELVRTGVDGKLAPKLASGL